MIKTKIINYFKKLKIYILILKFSGMNSKQNFKLNKITKKRTRSLSEGTNNFRPKKKIIRCSSTPSSPVKNKKKTNSKSTNLRQSCLISCKELQLCKGEDIIPKFKRIDTTDIFLVGDGHDGKGCKEIIDKNSDLIMIKAFREGTEKAMELAISLCKNEYSGAMLIIATYNLATRKLSCTSIGDSFFGYYKDDKCVYYQQGHQDIDLKILKEKGISLIIDDSIEAPKPRECGKIMDVNFKKKKKYFKFSNNTTIAASSSLGHNGFKCLDPITKKLTIPLSDFHFIFSSDGLTDVMNINDKILRDGETANDILKEARKRWFDPHWTLNMSNHPKIKQQKNFVYATDSKYSDDMTMIVAKYSFNKK